MARSAMQEVFEIRGRTAAVGMVDAAGFGAATDRRRASSLSPTQVVIQWDWVRVEWTAAQAAERPRVGRKAAGSKSTAIAKVRTLRVRGIPVPDPERETK